MLRMFREQRPERVAGVYVLIPRQAFSYYIEGPYNHPQYPAFTKRRPDGTIELDELTAARQFFPINERANTLLNGSAIVQLCVVDDDTIGRDEREAKSFVTQMLRSGNLTDEHIRVLELRVIKGSEMFKPQVCMVLVGTHLR